MTETPLFLKCSQVGRNSGMVARYAEGKGWKPYLRLKKKPHQHCVGVVDIPIETVVFSK